MKYRSQGYHQQWTIFTTLSQAELWKKNNNQYNGDGDTQDVASLSARAARAHKLLTCLVIDRAWSRIVEGQNLATTHIQKAWTVAQQSFHQLSNLSWC